MTDSATTRRGRPPKQRDPAAAWEYATDAETEGKCVSRRLRAAGIWEQRERTWNALHRDARRQAILVQLREAFPEGERGLAGWPAICAWLNAHHFRNREGRRVTPRVAAGWRRRLNMPVLRGRPGQNGLYGASLPWASTYLLLAWAASLYRSGGPEMPRLVASGSTQNEGRGVGSGLVVPHVSREREKAQATPPDERAAIAAPSPTESGDCGVLKPAAEATANSNTAERVCTWCAWKWLSPMPFRPTRCPLCACLTDRSA